MKLNAIVLMSGLFVFAQSAAGSDAITLADAAAGKHRSAANIARNTFRHPVETLEFFGARPDMTVVEIWPGGGGWYTEVLAPYLREQGTFYAANYDGSTGVAYYRENAQKFKDKLAARPEVYDKVIVTALTPPTALQAAPAGSVDLVLTFRNLHNWVRGDRAEAMFKVMFEVLKSGGTLGLVAHRGKDHMAGKEWARTGYLAESEAKRLAAVAGFKFLASREVNACRGRQSVQDFGPHECRLRW